MWGGQRVRQLAARFGLVRGSPVTTTTSTTNVNNTNTNNTTTNTTTTSNGILPSFMTPTSSNNNTTSSTSSNSTIKPRSNTLSSWLYRTTPEAEVISPRQIVNRYYLIKLLVIFGHLKDTHCILQILPSHLILSILSYIPHPFQSSWSPDRLDKNLTLSADHMTVTKKTIPTREWDNAKTRFPLRDGINYLTFNFLHLGTSPVKTKGSLYLGIAPDVFYRSVRCLNFTDYSDPHNPWCWSFLCAGVPFAPGIAAWGLEAVSYKDGFGTGDKIGIYVNTRTGVLFFFKNGKQVGKGMKDDRLVRARKEGIDLYGMVSFGGDDYKVSLEWKGAELYPDVKSESGMVVLATEDRQGINNKEDIYVQAGGDPTKLALG
eukprot:TRINITY_DN16982_c0_g1_i1.p1 TRINITY_DN16982_c0_g1~~TRINITY_DN16982_c0_g1_i1.p1  ORF type:complete len:374 (-),score=61.34 TRINITY_DN16982_c0_g1_i1:67-1188(-)